MTGPIESPRLVRATELVGLPVVTLSGDDVAEVRDVVYDRTGGSLVGFTLNGRGFLSGRMKRVLGTDTITSIGSRAVMVAGEEALAEPGDAPEQMEDAQDDGSVIGTPVVTDAGTRLGEIADVVVNLGKDAEAVGYELTSAPTADGHDRHRAFVPLPEQLALSGDALLVPSEFEHMVRDDLTGFGAAIDEFSAPSTDDRRVQGKGGDFRQLLADATKAELYEEAKVRDIHHRSTMTKAELRDALEAEVSA